MSAMKKILYILIVALLIALALVVQKQMNFSQKNNNVATIVSTGSTYIGTDIGGPFEMINHNGVEVSNRSFADRYKLIYFGFTYCPSICPTELQKMVMAYRELPEDIKPLVQMIFVSVDPERDTPEVMNEYVSLFDPTMIGLTGTQKQVNEVKEEYKVYSAKVSNEANTDYTVDHSSCIYFMSPDDQILDLFKMTSTPEEITEQISKMVFARQQI